MQMLKDIGHPYAKAGGLRHQLRNVQAGERTSHLFADEPADLGSEPSHVVGADVATPAAGDTVWFGTLRVHDTCGTCGREPP